MDDFNHRLFYIVLTFLLVISMSMMIALFTGCDGKDKLMDRPEAQGLTNNCRVFLYCLYLNQRNPDKTLCVSLADGCKQGNDLLLCASTTEVTLDKCLLLLRK
jgi:hypothetical protein